MSSTHRLVVGAGLAGACTPRGGGRRARGRAAPASAARRTGVVDGAEGVTVVSACSGHGAKIAPLLGELAADAETGAGGVPDRFRVS